MIEEQLVLKTRGAVQLNVTVAARAAPATLRSSSSSAGGAEREADPAPRASRGARQPAACASYSRASTRSSSACSPGPNAEPFKLLAVGVLDIRDPLAHLPQRFTVREPARVQHRVDGEPDTLQGREQQLRGRPGELPGRRASAPSASIAW